MNPKSKLTSTVLALLSLMAASCGSETTTDAADSSEADTSPLAVTVQNLSGDEELREGVLDLTEPCAVLESEGERLLILWPPNTATWLPDRSQIEFVGIGGTEVELIDQAAVAAGGSQAESLDGIELVSPVDSSCGYDAVWFLTSFIDTSFLAASPEDGVDGPVLRHLDSLTNEGEGAEVIGTLELEGDCLYLFQSEIDVRFPVVWPNPTSWDNEEQAVVLADGTEIGIGEAVSGGGGYADIERVELVAGPIAAALAEQCVDNTFGEIAIVNNQPDGIAKME